MGTTRRIASVEMSPHRACAHVLMATSFLGAQTGHSPTSPGRRVGTPAALPTMECSECDRDGKEVEGDLGSVDLQRSVSDPTG